MNIGQIKLLSWAAAGLLTLALAGYVWHFVGSMKLKSAPPDLAKIKLVLEDVEPAKAKSDDLVPYDTVTRLFHKMNWTGKEKVVEAPRDPNTNEKPPEIKAAELVHVFMVKADLADRKNSNVFLKYKAKAGVTNNGPAGGFLLKEGEHLAAPHDAIVVDQIVGDGVWFTFGDAARERELVGTDDFDLKGAVVVVGPEGVQRKASGGGIVPGKAPAFNPNRTTSIGPNHFVLGREDMAEWNNNFAGHLGQDLRTARHQDPKTGKYDGIEIKEVSPGSLAEQHGAKEGDIVKSINGHPVSSVQEAINFAKMNADKYTVWEVVVESNGKTKTITYQSPNQ